MKTTYLDYIDVHNSKLIFCLHMYIAFYVYIYIYIYVCARVCLRVCMCARVCAKGGEAFTLCTEAMEGLYRLSWVDFKGEFSGARDSKHRQLRAVAATQHGLPFLQ